MICQSKWKTLPAPSFPYLNCSKSLKKTKMSCIFCYNNCNKVIGVWKLQPQHSFPHGSSHTCTPLPPSLASPGLLLHSAGAQSQCELWMGRSGSRGPGGRGPQSQSSAPQTPPQTGQTGSCTGRNTACCALLLCRIRLLSHAGRMTERGKISLNITAILSALIYLWGCKNQHFVFM